MTPNFCACLHAYECGGRYRPGALRGMPEVPIASSATGPPEGWAAVGFVSPASFKGVFGLLTPDFGVETSQNRGSSKPLARRVDPVSRIVLEESLPLP